MKEGGAGSGFLFHVKDRRPEQRLILTWLENGTTLLGRAKRERGEEAKTRRANLTCFPSVIPTHTRGVGYADCERQNNLFPRILRKCYVVDAATGDL